MSEPRHEEEFPEDDGSAKFAWDQYMAWSNALNGGGRFSLAGINAMHWFREWWGRANRQVSK